MTDRKTRVPQRIEDAVAIRHSFCFLCLALLQNPELKRTNQNIRLPRISIVGLGYVGLATAVCFASRGYRVYGVEIDKRKCNLIQSGKSPIHEQGIDSDLEGCIDRGSFSCGADVREGVLNSEITFLTVGTPSKPSGEIDLNYIESASREVGGVIKEKNAYHLVVVKSTVTPGTTAGTVKKTLENSSGKAHPKDFGLCFNPEFLREGSAIQDTVNPDALIIGPKMNVPVKSSLTCTKGFMARIIFTTL